MSLYSLNETKRLLFQSCEDGSATTVQQLLTQHSDLRDQINSLTDDYGNSALIIASENGHTGIVKLLLQCGANVDHRNSRGWTALMKASENCDGDCKLEIIDLLLAHDAQVDLQSNEGYTALMVAAQNSRAKVATKLVREYGAIVGLKQKHSSRTALMEASESGSIDIVKLLIEYGADDLGWALVLAILNKHNDIIELLLKHSAQVDDQNWSLFLTQPPLVLAIEKGDADIVKLLLEHGAQQGIGQAITYAICNKNAEIVKILSEHGAQVDEDQFDLPPLLEAVKKGDADIVKLLLEHGAKLRLDRAIIDAIFDKNTEIIRILSEHGARVDEIDWPYPPLVEAVEKVDADVVKLLLEHGAKQGIGWAIKEAIFNKHTEIIQVFSEYGAQMDEDRFDLPPLLVAVEKGDADIVKLLLQRGAQQGLDQAITNAIFDKNAEIIRILSEHGAQVDEMDWLYTPLVEAVDKGDADIVKLLLEHGAKQGIDQAITNAINNKNVKIIKILSEYGAQVNEMYLFNQALTDAIFNKNAEIISILSEYGAQVDDKHSSDEPPLVVAVEKEDADVVKLLLKHGANVDQKNSYGWTALMKASKKGDSELEIIELLLKHGAQVDLQNNDGESALMVATQNSQAKLAAKLVLEYGASVGLKKKHSSRTALMEASENGSIDIVKLLLEHGTDDLGWALVLAILNKYKDIIELLLENGAQVDDKNWSLFFDQSPLIMAVETGDADIVKLLLKHGAKQGIEVIHILSGHGAQVDEIDLPGQPLLVEAVERGDADVVKALLKYGANVDKKNLDGWTALMKASQKGDSKFGIIELLLKHGAQVDLQNDDGESALMVAARNSQVKLATKLVRECGASVDLKQKHSSWTALMEASESGSIDIVKLLLDHGADDLGWALVLAILNKRNDIIDMLLEHGAQVDDKNWSLILNQSPLIMAVETGDADVVQLLLKHGAKQGIEVIHMLSGHGAHVNEIDLPSQPPLVVAVEKGDADILKLLLEHGAKQGICRAIADAIFNKNAEIIQILSEYGAQDCFDEPPLLEAVEKGDADIVKLLLKYGANVDKKNLDGWTALMKASQKGDSKLEIIELLLKHGAQVDLQNDDGESALIVAAQNSQAKLAIKLVREYGASVGLKKKHSSWTALMEASESGSIDIVKLLLDHGANDLGWALVLAILNKYNDIIELLLENGAQVDDKNWSSIFNQSPLIMAVETGDADIVKLLLKHGAKQGIEIIRILSGHGAHVDEIDLPGQPLLVEAVERGDADVVKALLKYGANVDKKNLDGWTALMKASQKGDSKLEIIELLLKHGAQVDLQNNEGYTALMVAAQNSQVKLATKLVHECGASVDLKQKHSSWTALMEASESGSIDIVKLLLEHGADDLGWALVLAILNKYNDIIELLLEHGAQVDDKNWSLFFYQSPLIMAVETGDADIVKLLLKHGAKQGIEVIHMLSGHGAQVDEIDLPKQPFLVEAVKKGDADILKLLLEHGAKQGICRAIKVAVFNKNAEIIQILSKYGAQDWFDEPPLLEAVEKGDADVVKLLLKYGANVDKKFLDGWTALMIASQKGDSKLGIIDLLLKHGAQVDLQNDAGESALMVAAQNRQAKVATILVQEYGASVGLKQKQSSRTALMEASESGSVDIVKLLLEHGADELGWALVLAILNKYKDIIELLLEYGAQIDDKKWSLFFCQSPLIMAVEIGDANIVKLLLKHGAKQGIEVIRILSGHDAQVDDINLPGQPLLQAVERGDADVVKLLLEHGVTQDIDWAMTDAIRSEQAEIIQLLSEHGAQVHDDDSDVWMEFNEEPELVTLCKYGNTKKNLNVVKLLLEHGAKKYRGWALTEAILNQHTEIVDLLLEHGVCVADDGNRAELGQISALIEASVNGNIDGLKLLLKYGEKEQYQGDLGWALCVAATPEIIRLLLDNGAEADEISSFGEIPLVKVSREGDIEAVKLMLNHGAKKYLPEALIGAIEYKCTDIIELITQHGAHVDDESWFDFDKMPALVQASMWGNIETVKLLLKYGAEKNLDWALEAASKGGHTEIVNFLLDYGVEVDDCDMFDTAALVEASRNGKTETVRFLLEQLGIINRLGLALRTASREGHLDIVQLLSEYGNAEDLGYALIEASRSGHTDITKFLIKCDVFVDFQDEEQNIALIIAGGNGHTDSVKLLIECGAEVNKQNSHGTSALMAASQANHTDVVKLLLKYEANVNLKDNNGQTAAKLTNNDDILFLLAAISDYKVDTIESEVDLHEEVQLTQEEEAHLIAIENAITETGMLDHTLVHGVFVGPPRSGKDSIMKRLLGQPASKISPSTGAVETAIHVKVEESCTYAATIGQSNWTRLEYDDEALHLMKTTSNNNNSSANFTIDGEKSTDIQIADPPSAVIESTSDNIDYPHNKTMHLQTESTSESQSDIDSQPVAVQNETSIQINKIERIHQKIKHKTPIEIFKEAIMKKGLEGLRKLLTNSWSLYLTNTGGQMEFQELLPLLVSGPSMFFITFQLHKDLNECFQVEYELPSGESSKCYQSSLSILDSILQTLSTIAAMGTFVYKGLQKKCVPLKPKVFLIGTHKDLLDKKSAATIINRIDAKLQEVIKSTSHYREGIIQFASKSRMIFAVNNHDPSDSDFQAIRSAVEKTVEKGDYKMRSPAHWMIYSLVVRQLQTRVESYDECFAIAKECGIKDENEFNEALHFIHTKMGLVRYFPHEELKDIVIVDPQILFEKVTELIVETFTFENFTNQSNREAFEDTGIFNLSDFTKISSRTGQKLTPTLFATILEYLRIAAQFQQGGETKYFLPCVLTHAQEKKSIYNSTIPQLIATFQCGYCPKGLFGTLITYLINDEMQSDFEWELDTKNIYRDEVCFQVGPYDTVTIRFMPTHLQISCAESNPDLPRINCTQEDVCQEVRESVEKGIKIVTSAINYIKAQHSFTFYCTSDVCSEDPHPSKLKEFKGKLCSLKCEKLNKCFPLPSGYEKWRLCSTEECHSLKEKLNKCHCSFLIDQLSTNNCEAKWRKIGTHLNFQQKELDIIQANPLLLNDAPTSWLSVMLSNWVEWAPGDSRGSTSYANLEDLKSAVSKAGFGVVAEELSLSQEAAAGETGQSTDTGRKRTSSSLAESSSKRPRLS